MLNAERVSLHDWVFASPVDSVSRRRWLPLSSTLVLAGFNIYEGLGIDDPEKAKWHDFVFRARGRDLRGAIFDFATLPRVDFAGAHLENASLDSVQLDRASFDATQLQGASLENAQLTAASFKFAQLSGAKLVGALIQGASFVDANLKGASLGDFFGLRAAHLEDAHFDRAQLQGADLVNTQLERASFDQAQLQGVDLDNAQLQGADLEGAGLQGARLQNASLVFANLRWAGLQGASLLDANLDGASLVDANLGGASLDRARVQGASLAGASLQGASLIGAQLQGASLDEAQLQGASLSEAHLEGTSLVGADLQGAGFVSATLQATDLRQADLWRSEGDYSHVNEVGLSHATWLSQRHGSRLSRPWDGEAYQALRATIEALPLGDLRDQALTRIERLDCLSTDTTLASCNHEAPLSVEATTWRKKLEDARVDDAGYMKSLASALKTLVCSQGDDTIYVLRGLSRVTLSTFNIPSRIESAGAEAPALVDFIMSKDCPVSASLTEADKAKSPPHKAGCEQTAGRPKPSVASIEAMLLYSAFVGLNARRDNPRRLIARPLSLAARVGDAHASAAGRRRATRASPPLLARSRAAKPQGSADRLGQTGGAARRPILSGGAYGPAALTTMGDRGSMCQRVAMIAIVERRLHCSVPLPALRAR